MFEIQAPNALRGVYPCMEPTDPLWNSPDLSAVGNWFTDTVTIANDGTSASACDSLLSSHQGNFAIFRREHCMLGEQLLRVQNAGATRALVIDSVIGRPLRFGNDSLSNQITIPFVVISKDEGDAILAAIDAGDTVIVNIGNKQGQNPVDVGIFMDKALWSSLPLYPSSGRIFPDETFGVWVFNKGQQAVQNIQVSFWINGFFTSYLDISDSLNLASGDSTFVAFNVQENYNWDNEVDYGYSLLNLSGDADTLDNRLVSQQFNTENGPHILSRTFINQNQPSQTPYDYLYQVPATTESRIGYSFKSKDIICWRIVNIGAYAEAGDEFFVNLTTLENYNPPYSLQQGQLSSFGIYYPTFTGFQIMDFGLSNPNDLHVEDTSGLDIQYFFNGGFNYKLAFTTDMYHDERRKQEPFHDIFVSLDGIDTIKLDPKLTLLMHSYAYISPSSCGWGIGEISADDFQLFPNPASDAFEIATEIEVQSIRMISLTGEVIPLHFNIHSDDYHFTAAPGVYLIEITDASRAIFTKRMLVAN